MESEQATTPRIKDLAQRFIEMRDQKQALETKIKDLDDEASLINMELVKALQDEEAQSVKIEGIGTVFLCGKFHAACPVNMREELINWLDANGVGDLAKRSVHPKTLESEYQKWVEEDKPLPPEDMVKVFKQTVARVRRS